MKPGSLILHFLFILFCTGQVDAQTSLDKSVSDPFEGKAYYADEIIGWKEFKDNPYINVIGLDTVEKGESYGNTTEFKDNKFIARYLTFCGNGCNSFVSGTYKVTGNQIALFLDSISYGGNCAGRSNESVKKSLGTFYWVKKEGGFYILRNIEDAKTLDYLAQVKDQVRSFRYITQTQIIMQFISVYNRYIKIVPAENNKEYQVLMTELSNWKSASENWRLAAEGYKITDEAEYKAYSKIALELDKILSDAQRKHIK